MIANNRLIEDWNTSNITDMSDLFKLDSTDGDDYYFTPDNTCNPNLSRWDVSKVTTFVSGHE